MKPAACAGCPYVERPGPVWSDGNPETAKLIVVAEAPGKDEVAEGKGLVGAAGQELWRLARVVGLQRYECYVANVVKCLPPGAADGDYRVDPRAIEHCKRAYLLGEIAQCRTEKIAALGKTALQALTGETQILRWRGVGIERKL